MIRVFNIFKRFSKISKFFTTYKIVWTKICLLRQYLTLWKGVLKTNQKRLFTTIVFPYIFSYKKFFYIVYKTIFHIIQFGNVEPLQMFVVAVRKRIKLLPMPWIHKLVKSKYKKEINLMRSHCSNFNNSKLRRK